MTGYTVHTGSTEKFSEGWDRIFAKGRKKTSKRSATRDKTAGQEQAKRAKPSRSKR